MTGALQTADRCAACAAPVDPHAGHCASCGSPVGHAARRVVTVAFCDLAGYTTYCSEHDPEDVHLLVRPLMNALRGVCEELGGRVPVIEGDGFMAVFGADESRADDPARAVLAGARMQALVRERRRAVPELPGLRVGLHLGEVLVAPSWEPGGTSVAGDVVNLASRLCKQAGEGEVLASLAVASCVPTSAWGEQAQVAIRGLVAPQTVCTLAWPELESADAVLLAESRTPFVDRPELEPVLAAVEQRGCLAIVGDAGMGKTRLALEAALRRGGLTLRARFSDLQDDSVPVQELAQGVLNALGTTALAPLVSRRTRRLAALPVESDEADSAAECLDALVVAIGTLSAANDVVVLLDDVDTGVGAARSLVEALTAAAPGRFALLVTARHPPAVAAPEIRLGPLPRDALQVFVERLLPGAPAPLATHLVDRSGGVPLFIEQYARLLVEDGTVVLDPAGTVLVHPERLGSLPTAMRLFVASRLDVLGPAARRVVSLAAVVGPVVDTDLLSYLVGRDEDMGEQLELLVERGFLDWLPPEPGLRPRVRFRHEVLREVAYEGLLKRDRGLTHRAAAEWYAVLPVVNQLAEEAAHLEAALQLGESDCELVRRLVDVLGQRAASVVEENPALALEVTARADAVARRHPDCSLDLLPVQLARARGLLADGADDEAGATAAEVARHSREQNRPDLESMAQLFAGLAYVAQAPERSSAHLDRAHVLFRAAGDQAGLARVETARAECAPVLADRLAAWERAYRAAMRAGEGRLASLAAQDLAMHASVRSPAEAESWSRTATELQRADDVVGAARLAAANSLIALMRLDYAAAVASADEARQLSTEARQGQVLLNAELFALEARLLSGLLDEADDAVARLLVVAEHRPGTYLRTNVLTCASLLRSRQGRGAEAVDLLAEMQHAAEALGPHYVAQWHAFHARVALERGDFAAATRHADEAARMEYELDVPAWALRERLVSLVSRLASGAFVALAELSQARSEARVVGADSVAGALGRWGELADALQGVGNHTLDLPEGPETVETRALDLEIAALRDARPELLINSAAVWAELGTTVWQARALLWHSELTGVDHPEAEELLTSLGSPEGLAESLRAQVRGLRG